MTTLERIIELIRSETMNANDINKVMNAIREQDAVLGDIVVCREEVEDIARTTFTGRGMSEEEEDEAACAVADEMEDAFPAAAENFWDAFIDATDSTAREAIG